MTEEEIEDIEATFVVHKKERKKERRRKILKIIFIILCVLFPLVAIMLFVVFPLIFMNNISLQRLLIFTHFGLPTNATYFEEYKMPGYRNKFVTVKDVDGKTNVSLGLWQMLPVELTYKAFHDINFDYDKALKHSNYSVLLYFHGTGEARSYNQRKFEVFRYYFHVIAFDYRSYADSTRAVLSESAVVNDCVQLYQWLLSQTNAPIYIWGHSLGSALAAKTVAHLRELDITPKALILESAFTSMKEELYVHPYGKIFSWLPWFKATVVNPLQKNGFVFDTAQNILQVSCPILLLHAEDDDVVPYKFGEELYEIALSRPKETANIAVYHQFDYDLDYDHYFLYQDPFFQYYVRDFIEDCNNSDITTEETFKSSMMLGLK